ncbi:hypothetical protein K458DRAFT_259199, partial [Lentithecium fluviatile CBS 122367]
VNTIYPNYHTDAGLRNVMARFLSRLDNDPSIQWIKVVDTDLNQIIGVTKRAIITEEKPGEVDLDGPVGVPEGWENDQEKAFAQALF